MKRMIGLIMLACSVLMVACTEEVITPADVVLEVDIRDYAGGNPVIVYNMSAKEMVADAQGHASLTLPRVSAAYANLYWGQTAKQLYFEGGDTLRISFSASSPDRSFKVKAPSEDAVNYLNTIVLPPFNDELFQSDIDVFKTEISKLEADALKLLDARKIEGSRHFRRLEEARIRYSYANMLLMYPVGHAMMASMPEYKPEESWYKAVRSYFTADENLLSLDAYRNFMIEAAHALDIENAQVSGVYPKTVAQMRYVADNILDEKVREGLIHYLAVAYVDFYGIDDIIDLENIYNTYVTDPYLIEDYKAKYDKWDLSTPGKISPEIHASDLDGKEHSLAEYRGKVIYIDLWATWCNPCRAELPHLKTLAKNLEGKDFMILGLSIDGNRKAWETKVREGGLPGIQLHVGPQSEFQQVYKIDGIPRFILLDKEGRIVSNSMSRPSDPATVEYIKRIIDK